MRIRLLALLIVLAITSGLAPPAWPDDTPPVDTIGSRAAAVEPFLDPLALYGALGTWTDIYDEHTYERPVAAVKAMHAQGVRTLFLETANYRIDTKMFRPRVVARMIEAAHQRGMKVVAWYLPSFRNVERDYRRSMAAIRFTTPNGHRFDGFAMDIESGVVRDLKVRNARMRRLSQRVRAAVGPDYPLNQGIPIHIIGGLSRDTTIPELRAFVDAAIARNVYGASMYEFETTTPRQWRVLQRLR